ncbi:hypothetical protein OG948_58800 (plasmid) [Embleya sp. NBC_00888]|uniref:hypothetical protein n=1 Tax=Embleya sp. NBC_00888 TaxID=2975960 RepID=UPI002F910638|nr:hypothetical protein OG948_58800 [Embleya sp. NBC_00888]
MGIWSVSATVIGGLTFVAAVACFGLCRARRAREAAKRVRMEAVLAGGIELHDAVRYTWGRTTWSSLEEVVLGRLHHEGRVHVSRDGLVTYAAREGGWTKAEDPIAEAALVAVRDRPHGLRLYELAEDPAYRVARDEHAPWPPEFVVVASQAREDLLDEAVQPVLWVWSGGIAGYLTWLVSWDALVDVRVMVGYPGVWAVALISAAFVLTGGLTSAALLESWPCHHHVSWTEIVKERCAEVVRRETSDLDPTIASALRLHRERSRMAADSNAAWSSYCGDICGEGDVYGDADGDL